MPSPYDALIVASHRPLPFVAIVFIGLLAVGVAARRMTRPDGPALRTLIAVASAVTLIGFAVLLGAYLRYPAYFDRVEPAVTSVSWLFAARDFPLYPAPADPRRYAHVYGPVSFMVEGAALRLLGPSLFTSKLVGVLASGLSLAVLFTACARAATTRVALFTTAVAAAAYLAFQVVAYWNRPDPLLLLLLAVAAACAFSSWRPGLWIIAIAAGLAANLKITAVLYFVPLVPVLASRYSPLELAGAAAVSAATVVAPFLHPRVDAASYAYWLRHCTGGRLVGWAIVSNLEWLLTLMLPALLVLVTAWRRLSAIERWTGVGLVAAGLAVSVLAAIPGAGPYHLLPFVPVVALFAVRSADGATAWSGRTLLGAAALVVATIAAFEQYRVFSALDWAQAARARDSAEALRSAYSGARIALLYGGDAAIASMARPLFVFDRDPYLVDGPAVMDHQMNGIEIPPATVDLLDRCAIEVALIPAGTRPLSTRNLYPTTGHRDTFAGPFADTFARRFRRVSTRGSFDVYVCDPTPAPSPAAGVS